MPTVRGVLGGLAVALTHLALAWLAARYAVLGSLTVWYAPAGLAMGLGAVLGWRILPAVAAGEVAVGMLLFGVAGDFGWLVVPNGIAFATVYVAAGVAVARSGAASADPERRRLLLLAGLVVVATATGAAVGVGFQALAGIVGADGVPRALLLWWLGDVVGVAGVGVTVVVVAIRLQRRARWWALPEIPVPRSLGLVVLPAALTLVVALGTDGVAPFAAAVFLPTLVLAVRSGLTGVALAAPLTSFTMSAVANDRYTADALGLTDLQLLLLLLLLTGFGVAHVLEGRTELQLRLAARERHLRDAQRQARAGSFRWDVPGDEVEWSEGLYELLGAERGPVTADDLLDRVHPEDHDRVAAGFATALATGDAQDHTYRVRRDDGTTLVVRARVEGRLHDGRVVEVHGTCTDVTREEEGARRLAELVTAEQEARAAEAEAREAIAATERIKHALLVAVSHEVRTPLTVLRGMLETLRRPELRDDRLGDHDQHLESLQRHTARLSRVLLDLLDVDRIGRGVVAPIRRPCDLAALAEEVVADLDRARVRVDLDLPSDPVELDARLTTRILEQLLANAARHAAPTGNGGPALVAVGGELVEGRLLLRVDDQGPGVPLDDRDRVFGAFEHGDVSAHDPGAGVGLFLVARFAELHGGRAWVTETDDGGASFRVELPVGAGEPASPDGGP